MPTIKPVLTLCGGLAFILFTLHALFDTSHNATDDIILDKHLDTVEIPQVPPTQKPEWLMHSSPQPRFRDNLKSDVKYITTWPSAGSTNDFLSALALIYVALNSDRVPILPNFYGSHHLQPDAGMLPFSTVYDLPRLSRKLGIPILEWHQVKDVSVPLEERPLETLGCWSLHQQLYNLGGHAVRPPTEIELALDISYWPIQNNARVAHGEDSNTANLLALSALSDPYYRELTLARKSREPEPCPHSKALLEPDEQLQCFDYLYFTGTYDQNQIEHYASFNPVWRWVGQFVHFNPDLLAISKAMLHRAFEIAEDIPTPPFIAVHVRRGDFSGWCESDVPRDDCFAPIADYATKVELVRAKLAARGIRVEHVIVASDESDPAWWEKVSAQSYRFIDHKKEETARVHGTWYPTIIDAAIQSMSTGLVGTDRSTFSLVSRKRIESWNPISAFENVYWGRPGMNDA